MERTKSVGILLFDEVEVLDFAGPYEVFSMAQASRDSGKAFAVKTVSQSGGPVKAAGGLGVQPDFSFETAPHFDILIVPGGYGARVLEIRNSTLLDWLKHRHESVEILASVCTGAFLLAEAGLLDGLSATTHWANIDKFGADYPAVKTQRGVKYVDCGRMITAAGVSAGIDMSLHIVERLLGRAAATGTAKGMEYSLSE